MYIHIEIIMTDIFFNVHNNPAVNSKNVLSYDTKSLKTQEHKGNISTTNISGQVLPTNH